MSPGPARAAALPGAPGARGAGGGGGRPAWALGALCLLLAAAAAAACLRLGVQAAALQRRVAALEQELQLLPRLEQLVREKLDGLAKLRKIREAPAECVCPPGPPGRRGKPGRRGDAGPPVSDLG
ncbi:collagen alpha-1(XXIII) chain-like [Sorex araneus]|uniref:collagen alpha-1(XXIII) chain-like n=1 Tax=Sorex araneus TaxID=42254 RepID=UPI0024339106|nr:collagen alpha-1(XXIII) chain-like [Sorex araneus]